MPLNDVFELAFFIVKNLGFSLKLVIMRRKTFLLIDVIMFRTEIYINEYLKFFGYLILF